MGIWAAPKSRLRLYTSLSQYRRIFSSLATGRHASGDSVTRLEESICELTGARHAIATPMARTGIYLLVRHMIQPGQEVIMSPYTIADVVNMVVCAGGRPVFADIDSASCNINPESVAELINPNTGLVMATHFYGQMADMEPLLQICADRNIPLIEDAAQAFGGRQKGRFSGTIGHAGVFSFGLYKNVNAFFGGMVVTDDDRLTADIRREIEQWPYQSAVGIAKKALSGLITDLVTRQPFFGFFFFHLFRWAFLNNVDVINNQLKIDVSPELKTELPADLKCRMLPVQARLVQRQLGNVDSDTASRLAAARQYHSGLSDIPELHLAPLCEDLSHIYWYFPIQYEDRADLVAHVLREGQDITPSYHRNCAALPCFEEYARPCPNAQKTADSVVYLPTYPAYGSRQIDKTIKAIRSYFGK